MTETFGKELWKKATIALTFANKVEDPSGGDGEAYFLEGLANWREAIHSFLGNELKLEPELVQSLPMVPTGYYRPFSVLPNGENWLSELWIACDNDVARLNQLKKDKEQQHSFWKNTWDLLKEYYYRLDPILGISQFFRKVYKS